MTNDPIPMDPIMTVWALRYALGRSSYAVGMVADEVARLARAGLPADVLATLRLDVCDHLHRYGAQEANCDRTAWERLLEVLLEEETLRAAK